MIPNKELRKYVFDLLNGQITYLTKVVPVYSLPPVDAPFPYIHLDSINLTDESTKDGVVYTARFSINIYDQFLEEAANWTRIEEIGSSLVELLAGVTGSTTNWNVVIAFPESFDQQEQITETKRALVANIVMNYYVEQK